MTPPFRRSSSLAAAFFFFLRSTSALVQFYSSPFFFSFLDAPARFAVPLDRSTICGSVHVANPLEACSPIEGAHNATIYSPTKQRFVLISRGTCNFEDKVRNAQNAGFQAAIIYNNQEMSSLYSMVGDPTGIKIHAVFISKAAGETLKKLSRGEGKECCIDARDETQATVLVISFVSLLVILSVFATFLFARNIHLLRRAGCNRPTSVNRRDVELLPCFVYRDGEMGEKGNNACSICLDEYRDGETVRVLPCRHEFHTVCVDLWLTKWGTCCPVCKHELASVGG